MSRAAKAAGAPRLQRNGSLLGAESAARCRTSASGSSLSALGNGGMVQVPSTALHAARWAATAKTPPGAAQDAGSRRSSAPRSLRPKRTGDVDPLELARGNGRASGAVPTTVRPHPARALPQWGCHRVGQGTRGSHRSIGPRRVRQHRK